jgi:hypothetical protein
MKWIRRPRPSPGTVFGLAALVIAIGGAAFAAIPDSSGVIHGCYDRRGALRVVDTEAGRTCRTSETALTWNQQGPPGPPGGLATEFAEETAEVSTASRSFVDLGGPAVNATVPESGLVAAVVRAEVHGTVQFLTEGSLTEGCVGLFVDSQPFSGDLAGNLFCEAGDVADRSYVKRLVGWNTFEASPGPHTFSLRYKAHCLSGTCPPEDEGFFRNRKIWITPIG